MLEQKIADIEKKMSNCDPSSMMYMTYADILVQLKEQRQPVAIRVHSDPNDNLCESCQ